MVVYTLYRRWRTGSLVHIEAESSGRAVERAVATGVSLAHADLGALDAPGCFLPGADLRGVDLEGAILPGSHLGRADLRSASLINADLRRATLRRAILRRADLRRADFGRADLRGADFAGADLRDARAVGARLDGARLDWRSSTFVVELLRRDANLHPHAHRLIAEIAFERDDRPYAWLSKIARRPDLIDWATSVISRAIQPGDDAPEVLRRLATDMVEDGGVPPNAEPAGFYWTRAMHRRETPRRVTR